MAPSSIDKLVISTISLSTIIISAFIGGILLAFYNENEYYLVMSILALIVLYAG